MKDTQPKPPTKVKSKPSIAKVKMPAKKVKEPKSKAPKVGKVKKPNPKINKKTKSQKEETVTTPKRKRGRPRNEDRVQIKKKIKEPQKTVKNADNKPGRKRKIPIKSEKEFSPSPPKKPKINDSNCNMNGNSKTVLPNIFKPCHQKEESSVEHAVANHINSNGSTLHYKKNVSDTKKQQPSNSIIKSATFIPPPPKKIIMNGKSCLKIFKPILNKDTKFEQEVAAPKTTIKNVKVGKASNAVVPFKQPVPVKLHPQRMASLDAMAKLHVICIPDRKPIEHHSRTTTSVVTVCSQPSPHQGSVTQVHERIHFDLKKEGKDFKSSIVHKQQINYVKEKQEVFVSHSIEQSSVLEKSKSSIKSEKDSEKKKKTKPSQKVASNAVQKKDSKLNQSVSKCSDVSSAKSEKKSKAVKNNEVVKKCAKTSKVSKQIKKPAKDKQIVKANNNKTKKLEQTKSEVKVKETIRMQKTCTYQSVTTVNSHGTTNSSVVPVSHVGLTTNYSKTKKTVVTDEECKDNLNYSSGSVINKSYCVTSESPCSLGHQSDCCKFHTHSPQIIPFAHVQACSLGHSLSRTSDSSSSSPSHCDGSFGIHRFGHQQPLIYSSPAQECGCCCSGALVQNVRDPCLLRKSIMTYPHHFPHHTHLPASAFSHESLCTDYHPTTTSIDTSRHHAQHYSLTTSHPRVGCCSYCDLHSGGSQCHHQSPGNCLQYISSPKSSTSLASCEQSPLDLSLASATSGSSLEADHPLPQGHCPSLLCCPGEVLLLRTSPPHGFQHTTFAPKSPCCRCGNPVTRENPTVESVQQQVQCPSRNLESSSQSHQLVDNIALRSPTASRVSVIPPVPPTNAINQNAPHVMTENLLEAKLEKSISPKQSSKISLPKKRQFSHGWSWKGKPREKMIALTNDSIACPRMCYPSVQHKEGDVISERDCVLLRSGPKDTDLPYVAKVTALWENPEDGEMMMSLLWYYRPEHTDQGRKSGQMEDEVFASRHKDVNSIACIEDKCYVLTYNEYCRYRASLTMEDDLKSLATMLVPDFSDHYSRKTRLPVEIVANDIVFFCRHVYDFRQKRILKNPT